MSSFDIHVPTPEQQERIEKALLALKRAAREIFGSIDGPNDPQVQPDRLVSKGRWASMAFTSLERVGLELYEAISHDE